MYNVVTDKPPESLYKYRGCDKNRDGAEPYARDRAIIEGCALWAGSPLTFNDPFDCYPVIDFEGTREEKEAWATRIALKFGVPIHKVVEKVEKALSDPAMREQLSVWRGFIKGVGVLSLTERPDDMLMWAHYANSHRGYCLELSATIPPFSVSWRVQYARERPKFRLFDSDRANIITRVLLHKADFWSHEHESTNGESLVPPMPDRSRFRRNA